MKIGLVIPWREQPHRIHLLKVLQNWYQTNLPNIDIFYADKPGEFWSSSGSRNLGVKKAQEAQCDVIIINDADTIPEIKPLLEAIKACKQDNMVHNPYSHCKVFSEEETTRYFNGAELNKIYCQTISTLSNGGIYVTTPEAWWSVGGQDEKFIQWGYEDTAFELAHQIIKGVPLIKHEGYIYSLYHKQQFHDNGYVENHFKNKEVYLKYRNIKSIEELLELIKSN